MAAENPSCPNCAEWPDAREGLSKYDGYCATCFKHCYPRDPRALQIEPASREQRVRDEIVVTFPHIDFIFNKPIHTKGTGCDCPSRRRIDNYVHLGGTTLAIEVDENAHRHYDQEDEKNRYDELLTDCGTKMVYIRFNPDPTPTDRSVLEDRLKPLMEEIQRQLDRIQRWENTEIVEIYYMYYPEKSTKRQMSSENLTCPHCQKTYSDKYCLIKHINRVHPDPENETDAKHTCSSQQCTFQSRYGWELKKHIPKCLHVHYDQKVVELQVGYQQQIESIRQAHRIELDSLRETYREELLEKDKEIQRLLAKLEVTESHFNRMADRSAIRSDRR
jgi:hypothetical protein